MRKILIGSVLIIICGLFPQPRRCNGEMYAYIANSNDNTISVIDIIDHKVVDTLENLELENPLGVAVSSAGNYVFIANRDERKISVLQTTSNQIYREISVAAGLTPQGVAVSVDGKFLYLTASSTAGAGSLYIRNTISGLEVGKITVGTDPLGLATFSDDEVGVYYAYVANKTSGTVSVIADLEKIDDLKDGSVNDASPTGVAISPGLNYVYVTNERDNSISVIKRADNSFLSPIEVGTGPVGIATASNGDDSHYVYVANSGEDSVSFLEIESATGKISFRDVVDDSRYPFSQPYGVSVTPDGTYVYVTNRGNDTVSVIETASQEIVKRVPVGENPTSFGHFIGTIPPNPPTELEATAESDRVDLQWNDESSDELGFEIEKKAEGEDDYSLIHTASPLEDSYTDTSVTETITYNYRVRAFNNVGESEYATDQVSVPLKAPVELSLVGISEDSITLDWKDKSRAESGYEIERRTIVESSTANETDSDETDDSLSTSSTLSDGNDSFTEIATVGADSTTYTDSGLDSGTTYVYRVRAFQNSSGETSDYSNEVEGETDEDYLCFIGTAAYGSQGSSYIFKAPDNPYVLASLLLCCLGIMLRKLEMRKHVPSTVRHSTP